MIGGRDHGLVGRGNLSGPRAGEVESSGVWREMERRRFPEAQLRRYGGRAAEVGADNAIRGMGLRRRPIAEGGQASGAGTPRNLRPCDRPSQATDRDSDRRRRSPVLLGSPPVPPSSTSYESQPAPGLRRSLGPPHLANPMWLGRWATRLGWGRCGAEAGEGAEVGSAGLAQGWATGAGFGIWVGAADSRSGQPHAAMSEAL
jgi:hypothetical protein